jgi:hypothetical protein
MIYFDDFPILMESWTWEAAYRNILLPFNEHIMPLGRLSTWCLGQLSNPITRLPYFTAVQGIAATVAAMWLLYLFVRRETGDPNCGLAAMILFGVSTVYVEAISWFAASFTLLAVDMVFLALLAAQRWQQSGRGIFLFWCVFWSVLAPGWFASGLLGGLFCTLYLFPKRNGQFANRWYRALALVPLLGPAIFLGCTLPFAAQHLLHLDHYSGRNPWESFNLLQGSALACRASVDKILLGLFGISGIALPSLCVAVILLLAMAGGVWLWHRTRHRRLMLLGLGFLVASSVVIYSARADWSYEDQTISWTRYNVFPHLGLTLFICRGLAGLKEKTLAPVQCSSPRVASITLLALIAVLFLINMPRGLLLAPPYDPGQIELFRRIAEMDALCRNHHISAATARRALNKLPVAQWDTNANGWIFLRGSNSPREMNLQEARAFLYPEG